MAFKFVCEAAFKVIRQRPNSHFIIHYLMCWPSAKKLPAENHQLSFLNQQEAPFMEEKRMFLDLFMLGSFNMPFQTSESSQV